MLIQFDRFLHDRVFNPLSLMMQRRFRVNRYHLLVIFGVVDILMNIGFMFIGSLVLYSTNGNVIEGLTAVVSFAGIAIWLSAGMATSQLSALAEAAARFEEGGFVSQPTKLIMLAMLYESIRPNVNLLLVVFPLLFLNGMFGWLTVQLGGHADQMSALSLGRAAYLACFIYEIHLWHVQDLDPRDREYHRQLQKSTS